MKMNKMIVGFVASMLVVTAEAASVGVDTPEFALSIKHDGVRESDGNEPLAVGFQAFVQSKRYL